MAGAMEGSDHDRLIRLEGEVRALASQLQGHREATERLMETYEQGAKSLAMSESRGYIDGQMRSVMDSLETIRAALQTEIGEVKQVVHGKNGDNGLRSQVWRLRVIVGILSALLVAMAGKLWGIKIPLIM